MTSAIRRILDHVFNDLNLRRVNIHCGKENLASRKIAESLAFQKEGVYRQAEKIKGTYIDLVAYGLLKEEFQSTR